jgi:hypothetical protein
MDDLRYLLRVLHRVGRLIRRRLRRTWHARQALKFLLLVVVGVLFWAAVRRYISSELVDAAFWVAVAVVGAWAGVRVGSVAKRVYLYQRRLRSRDSERFFAFVYEATLEPHSERLHQLALQTLHEAETYLQTTLPSRLGLVDIVTEPLARIRRNEPTGYSGWAQQETESITIVYREDMDALCRTFLHEWAHIITACWNEDAPALFLEGIAEATEYHGSPTTAHSYALYFLHYLPSCPLLLLLDGTRFYDQERQHAHYAWAGSFTLYLIEQFGLARFREFYTQLRRGEEDCAFQQVFGMSLGQAEMLWREYLHTQLPESVRAETLQEVLEHRLRWAIMDGEGIVVVQALSGQMVQDAPRLLVRLLRAGVLRFLGRRPAKCAAGVRAGERRACPERRRPARTRVVRVRASVRPAADARARRCVLPDRPAVSRLRRCPRRLPRARQPLPRNAL